MLLTDGNNKSWNLFALTSLYSTLLYLSLSVFNLFFFASNSFSVSPCLLGFLRNKLFLTLRFLFINVPKNNSHFSHYTWQLVIKTGVIRNKPLAVSYKSQNGRYTRQPVNETAIIGMKQALAVPYTCQPLYGDRLYHIDFQPHSHIVLNIFIKDQSIKVLLIGKTTHVLNVVFEVVKLPFVQCKPVLLEIKYSSINSTLGRVNLVPPLYLFYSHIYSHISML